MEQEEQRGPTNTLHKSTLKERNQLHAFIQHHTSRYPASLGKQTPGAKSVVPTLCTLFQYFYHLTNVSRNFQKPSKTLSSRDIHESFSSSFDVRVCSNTLCSGSGAADCCQTKLCMLCASRHVRQATGQCPEQLT